MTRDPEGSHPSGAPASPRRIRVAGSQPYTVVIGPGVLSELERVLPGGPAAVLTDATVERLQAGRRGATVRLPRRAVPPGEDSKSFAVLERVLDFLVQAGLDRRGTLIAFGGGVVGDLGGLAAALFMRGIACVQCPTTLLAQVDSSVGGKTAVNLRAGKNLAGAFHPPRLVLADTQTLATLPDEELRSGFGEVVKSALLGDGQLLELLEHEAPALLARDAGLFAEVVARCVELKAAIVARDEHERHERKLLNLGHTFAHAIEGAAGFGRVPHGIAVGVGLVLALRASKLAGLLREPELLVRVPRLLERLRLPTELAALRPRNDVHLAAEELVAAMRHDKKGRAARPAFVLVEGLGKLLLDQELDERTLVELLR